jgi:hypothetical protein
MYLVTARHQWLTPVILASQEAAIRRIKVQSQLGQVVREILSQKNQKPKNPLHTHTQKRLTQGAGPEFKPQYWQKKLKLKNKCISSQ